jgi:hypothetical protein
MIIVPVRQEKLLPQGSIPLCHFSYTSAILLQIRLCSRNIMNYNIYVSSISQSGLNI